MPTIYVSGADYSLAGLGKYPTNPLNYQDEMKAILDANIITALTGENASTYNEALNEFIRKLKVSGVWDKMDYLFMPWLSQSRSEMQFNLKTLSVDTGLFIPSATMATVNYGYRNLATTVAGSQPDKSGIKLPSHAIDYEDIHISLYHNKMKINATGEVINRSTVLNTKDFTNIVITPTSTVARLGYANDANRITFTGFDINQNASQKKLIGFNTTRVGADLKAKYLVTGYNSAGEMSEITVPEGYFVGDVPDIYFVGGESSQYRANTCIISSGRSLTPEQWAAYRNACDAMDAELLGVIPSFTVV